MRALLHYFDSGAESFDVTKVTAGCCVYHVFQMVKLDEYKVHIAKYNAADPIRSFIGVSFWASNIHLFFSSAQEMKRSKKGTRKCEHDEDADDYLKV